MKWPAISVFRRASLEILPAPGLSRSGRTAVSGRGEGLLRGTDAGTTRTFPTVGDEFSRQLTHQLRYLIPLSFWTAPLNFGLESWARLPCCHFRNSPGPKYHSWLLWPWRSQAQTRNFRLGGWCTTGTTCIFKNKTACFLVKSYFSVMNITGKTKNNKK